MNRIRQAYEAIKGRYGGQTPIQGAYKLSKDALYVLGLGSLLIPQPTRQNTYIDRPVVFVIPSGDHGRLLRLRSGEGVAASNRLIHVVVEDASVQPAEGSESEMEAAAPINPATPMKPAGAGGRE